MKKYKMKESDLKSQIKDYLARLGIFSFPITQGLGSYRGAPDRIMFYDGKAYFLEIKLPDGRMSEHQLAFQIQCGLDGIPYRMVRSIEDLEAILKEGRDNGK